MRLSKAMEDTVGLRRERVAQLRLRGLTVREIAISLAMGDRDGNNRIVNPETGDPYTHTTIINDLKVLKKEWHESSGEATEEHAARQFAEIQEIKRVAWALKDPQLALAALDREMRLLGTAKGTTININVSITIVNQLVVLIEQFGGNAEEWFTEMINEFALAQDDHALPSGS